MGFHLTLKSFASHDENTPRWHMQIAICLSCSGCMCVCAGEGVRRWCQTYHEQIIICNRMWLDCFNILPAPSVLTTQHWNTHSLQQRRWSTPMYLSCPGWYYGIELTALVSGRARESRSFVHRRAFRLRYGAVCKFNTGALYGEPVYEFVCKLVCELVCGWNSIIDCLIYISNFLSLAY